VRALVTGGAGFIGSNLAKRLVADGHDVVVVDDFQSGDWKNLVDFTGDVVTTNLTSYRDVMMRFLKRERFDVVFHQASITDTTVHDSLRMMNNNVEAFLLVLVLARRWDARVIWASSCSIYGQGPVPMKESQKPDPLNVYAYSKLAMERMAMRWAPKLAHPIVGLRYSNVYGPGEAHKGKFASMVYQLAKQMREGKRPRIFKAGQQKRDFVSVWDVVQANLNAMNAKESGSFNAGAGASWSFNELVAELNRALGTKLEPDYFENPYSFTQDWTQTDLTEAKRVLGYQPQHDLRKGVEAYLESGKLGV
jgi:ADP-L-glycero-D-manno-heptose 6-epimerase